MWKIVTLTTAANTANLAFSGRGSIYIEGTLGGGTVQIKPIAENIENGPRVVATGFAYALDGTTKSADVPSGLYQLNLNGSVGATVDAYFNDQKEQVISG